MVEKLSIALSIVSIAVTIVISFIATAFSIWFFKESKRSEKETATTLVHVKMAADVVRHEIQLVADSVHSILRRGSGDGWINEMCCPNNEVIQRERRVRRDGKIYVSVVTMDYEVSQFIQVIADNLKEGKQYFYFLPADILGGYEGEMQKFLRALTTSEEVPEETLKNNLQIVKVRSGEILCNVTLLDPGVGADEGFILPAYDNAERAFSVKLDRTLYNRAWTRVQEWLHETESIDPIGLETEGGATSRAMTIWPLLDNRQKELTG